MVAAGLLARKAVAKGLTVKPWVKTSLAPGSQVVADYYEKSGPAEGSRRARLQPGRLRLHHLHRQFRPAAGGDLRGDQQARSGGRGGALRQPQLRRPRQRRRAGQLSRVAAAGGRLCDRRLDVRRRRQAAARPRQEGQEGLPQGHLADQPRDQFDHPPVHHQAGVRQEVRQRVQGRRRLGQDRGQGRPDLRLGRPLDLRAEPALLRRHGASASGRSRTSSTRASSACSSIRSRPTTSRRPARSRKRAPPASTCATTRCARRTSTSTARGAAIIR